MRIFLFLALALIVTGCSQPGVKLKGPETQHKVDTASDWRRIAFVATNKLLPALLEVEEIDPAAHERSLDNKMPVPPLGVREYYIHAQNAGAPFTDAFTPLFSEQIKNRGPSVRLNAQNAVVINYSAQTYYYGGGGSSRRPIDNITLPAMVAALGIQSSKWSLSVGQAALSVAAAGVVLDTLISMGEITNAEVVLTVSVVSKDRVLYQHSEILYINPADLPFYWSDYPATPPMETAYFGEDIVKARNFQLRGQ